MNTIKQTLLLLLFITVTNLDAQTSIVKRVLHEGHNINVNDYENPSKPVIILLHGFPDNAHLYDLLVPELSHDFEIITFYFLGWGKSDKPKKYKYTSSNQKEELNSVISQLQIINPILVAHDASGPPAIDWAIENEEKISKLVLLNTYYSDMKTLKAPEAIWMFSTPIIRELARFLGVVEEIVFFTRYTNGK